MSLNSGSKAKENHESWESLFRKTMYKEPLFSFTKPAENPIHWIHLLDSFDQQDTYKGSKSTNVGGGHKNGSASQSTELSNLSTAGSKGSPKGVQGPGEKLPSLKIPEAVAALAQVAAKASGESFFGGSTSLPGWPLMPFSKVRMFKCEKCCLEFCSPTNHRRHLRMIHRRPVNAEKEDIRTQRQQLATFWDNLCPEAAYNIVASRNLALEDLTGEQVVKALTHLLQQPSLFALPHSYVKAGAMLLEVVQNKSSRLVLTSSELFKILDGSSERTFPSFGLDSMHRYVFEGGAGKVGLELKNLVASLGFFVELNLVKAFINNKDEEAMRCQTALVEEEAASQRKRAEIQERKRLKKIRQKESRDKDLKPLKRFPPSSDSDLTDEGNSPGGGEGDDFGYDLQSRPSSNTYENLYYRLTNEKSDTDYQEEIMSTEPFNLCKDNDHNEVGDVVITGSEVATAPEDSKSGSKKSAKNIATKKGSFLDSTDVLKSGVEQQFKYSTDYSFSSRGRFIPVPKYKQAWKERKWMDSTRSFSKESHADDTNKKNPEMNFKEDMASANPSCTSGTIVEDPSGSTGNKSLIFRPRQYLPRPIKMKKYQPTAGMGHAVWTRKVPKSSNAVPEKMPLSEVGLPNGPSQDSGDLAVDSTVTCCSAVEVSAAAVPHGSSSGPSSISPGNVCPTYEPVSLVRLDSDNSQPSKVANIIDICDCPNPSSVFPSDDLNHCLKAHIPSTTAACHSVVIGSLSVSLVDPLLDLEKAGVTDVAEVMKEVDLVPERKHTVEQLYAAGRTDIVEESLGALHENGLIQSVSHKDPERHGKDLKFSSQLDPEGKENHEHYTSQAGHERFTKATLVSGGNPKGGRMKMWRPVSATTSHDSFIDCLATSCSPSNDDLGKLPASCSGTTDNTKSVLLNQITTGWDSNTEVNISHALEAEGELSKGTIEDVGVASYAYKGTSACLLGTDVEAFAASMEQENSLVKENSAVRSVSVNESFCWSGSSTYESVACFLSQRWTDAVNEPDSLVLSVDTGKLCPSQSCNSIVDVHGVVSIVNPKDMRKISSHSGNDAFTRNDRKSWHHGLRKQGCPGSTLAVSRRFTAKDRSHLSLKSTDCRYIPK